MCEGFFFLRTVGDQVSRGPLTLRRILRIVDMSRPAVFVLSAAWSCERLTQVATCEDERLMGSIFDSNYETVSAACDRCGFVSIFSRIDDIGEVMPISGRRVGCSSCSAEFWINGDVVNTAYQFLIDDAREHFAMKRYMPAIASVAQAWEVFFVTCALSTFVYRPFFATDPLDQRVDDLNQLHRDVYAATAKFTWYPMRNLVMNMILEDPRPTTLTEAKTLIARLSAFGNEPSSVTLSATSEAKQREMLLALAGLTVGSLRNNVIHKHAYRPRRAEVEPCLTSEISLLYRVKHHLGVGDFLEHQADAVFEARD